MEHKLPKSYPNLPRVPLKFDEYSTLRNLFGTLVIVSHASETMQDRLSLIPYGKRDMAMILSQFAKLLQSLVNTTPGDRLEQLRCELEHTHMEVKTTKAKPNRLTNGTTYVPTLPLERVITKAMEMDCFACEKCGRDVLNCELRQDIQKLYHYDFPNDWRKGCPLAQRFSISEVINDAESVGKTAEE